MNPNKHAVNQETLLQSSDDDLKTSDVLNPDVLLLHEHRSGGRVYVPEKVRSVTE